MAVINDLMVNGSERVQNDLYVNGNVSVNGKLLMDLIYPVGVTYVQYPQQASPNDLWGAFSTWEEIDYDGAFFRASGGNANDFIEESGDLSKQSDMVKSHTHYFSWSGSHAHYVNPSCLTNCGNPDGGDDYTGSGHAYDRYVTNSANRVASYGWTNDSSAGRQIVNSASISVAGNTQSNDDSATETRPENYTIKVWKRTV